MTYSVAWKTDTAAFIVTDTAVTTAYDHNIRETNETTSFCEQQGKLGRDNYVYENAYKIFSKSNMAYSLAGDVRFGSEFINDVAFRIEVGFDVETAIKGAIDNYLDFQSEPAIEITLAFYCEQPKLITIKNKRATFVKIEGGLVLIGSPTKELLEYTNTFHGVFMDDYLKMPLGSVSDEELLIKMIALLQSYGIHNYTIENGIGGAYTGLSVTSFGIEYQPDICYLISGENPAFDTQKIATVNVNEHSVCIINTDISDIVISNNNSDVSEECRLSLLEDSRNRFDNGEYKYFIFMNTFCHVVCIINMNFNHDHLLLSLDVREDKEGTLGLIVSTELQMMLNDGYKVPRNIQDTTFHCIPFIRAPVAKVELVKSEIRKLRVGKIINNVMPKYKFILMESGVMFDWYYGNQDSIIPFLKYNKDKEFIRVVDLSTDMVSLEFENGDIIFPELGYHVNELFINIVNKERKEDIYIFDFYPNNGEDEFLFVHVLANDVDDAFNKATVSVTNEYGDNQALIFSGKQFYHPKYFWSDQLPKT
ncbi:hypothetical protein [Psychromonas sp. SP041]|uniref:hypothetical protein n=1 Tax=Psychromonas sp. SP041 TaxID=1365007 RepID=UPI0004037C1E|nr:hypothetical protein [Psychromonas sp. SP041]